MFKAYNRIMALVAINQYAGVERVKSNCLIKYFHVQVELHKCSIKTS